jgi:poly(hydroxyalkanoate) depolymerase family esterase
VAAVCGYFFVEENMAKRAGNLFLSRAFQRTLSAMTRSAMRTGTKAMTQTLRAKPAKRVPAAQGRSGVAISTTGARRYRLFKPLGVRRNEQLPLVVMLHGCGQDAHGLSASSRMNRVAERERFLVLYPEQDRMANAQGCWNWYDTRTGRAQAEADSIDAAISLTQPVDRNRIAVAGLSAGAGMAALLAMRHPERFRAVAMHSGIAPGVAHSSATALSAMFGRRVKAVPAAPLAAGIHLPALLVIQGSADHVVAPPNGAEAARSWAASEGATSAAAGATRTVQRGARYSMKVTDYRVQRRLVATLCEVMGLGHAWSGGAAGQAYSDPKGPDASRMIWAFIARQFAAVRA